MNPTLQEILALVFSQGQQINTLTAENKRLTEENARLSAELKPPEPKRKRGVNP